MMINSYQRGTDLDNCPDYCKYLRGRYLRSEKFGIGPEFKHECSAFSVDTCPREEHKCFGCDKWVCASSDTDTCPRGKADEPVDFCGTCEQLYNRSGQPCELYVKMPIATLTCANWKERTND